MIWTSFLFFIFYKLFSINPKNCKVEMIIQFFKMFMYYVSKWRTISFLRKGKKKNCLGKSNQSSFLFQKSTLPSVHTVQDSIYNPSIIVIACLLHYVFRGLSNLTPPPLPRNGKQTDRLTHSHENTEQTAFPSNLSTAHSMVSF